MIRWGEVNIFCNSSFAIHPWCCLPKITPMSLNLLKLCTKYCFSRFWASRSVLDSETCTACVSTFCVVSGTLHVVLLSLVLDVDESCNYKSTCWTVGRRQPCYRWSSAYRRQLRRLFLARSHNIQPRESAGHVFLFVNIVRSSRLAAINGPRWPTWNSLLLKTRRHWTLTDWCTNVSALETTLGPRVLCVHALYKLSFTYLLLFIVHCGNRKFKVTFL